MVGYVLGESKQSVITETNAITGDTKLIVKAENGETTTYHIIFNKLKFIYFFFCFDIDICQKEVYNIQRAKSSNGGRYGKG